MKRRKLSGIATPILTPFAADGTICERLYHAHATHCLDEGSHYLAPFGTTGEAASLSAATRMAALEALISSGTARPDQLLPGTGLPALDDTVELTRHAVDLDVAAVLLLPPFFYTDVEDEGLYAYVASLIERIADDRLRILLYNIPNYAGIGYSPALTRRLALDYPGIIAGYKDSSGHWPHTAQILRAAPEISVFPGSESFLPQAMASGGAGCISASCNVNIGAIREVFELLSVGHSAEAKPGMLKLEHVRKSLAHLGLIQSCKAIVAERTGEEDWRRCLPPLANAPRKLSGALMAIARSQPEEISSM